MPVAPPLALGFKFAAAAPRRAGGWRSAGGLRTDTRRRKRCQRLPSYYPTCQAQQDEVRGESGEVGGEASISHRLEANSEKQTAGEVSGLDASAEAKSAVEKESQAKNVYIIEAGRYNALLSRSLGIAKNGAIFLIGISIFITVFQTVRKILSPKAARKRTVNKNRNLIDELLLYLPNKRTELTQQVAWMIKMKTGFSSTEIFRKYLWFLLREKTFDEEAIDDLVLLKSSFKMSDDDVAAALKHRAQRVYKDYGTLMMNTEGMTAAGVERKAAGRALFSKLLYLAECEKLLNQSSDAIQRVDLREIFGATEDDVERLRIVSLHNIDFDKLESMVSEDDKTDSNDSNPQ